MYSSYTAIAVAVPHWCLNNYIRQPENWFCIFRLLNKIELQNRHDTVALSLMRLCTIVYGESCCLISFSFCNYHYRKWQVDEFGTYVGRKKNKVWLMYAYDPDTIEVVVV